MWSKQTYNTYAFIINYINKVGENLPLPFTHLSIFFSANILIATFSADILNENPETSLEKNVWAYLCCQ